MSTQRVAAIGLVVGYVLGQAGGMAPTVQLADALWATSSIGLVVGSVLLGLHHGRGGRDLVAAGFMMLAMAECVMWSGGSMATEAGRQAFGAGTLFYVPALLAISLPTTYPSVVRIGGTLSALAFGAHAARFVLGDARPSSAAESIAGYVLLTVAAVGWTIRAWRQDARAESAELAGAVVGSGA